MTRATHISDQNSHFVAIGALRVLIHKDKEGLWFAQGVEIDYGASGESLEDVKHRFQTGLTKTIHANLKRLGSIDKMLKYAPASEWSRLKDAKRFKLHMVTMHSVDAFTTNLPFEQIAYLQEKTAA